MKAPTLALTALAATLLSAGSAPAIAADKHDDGVSVSYGDLDLNTVAGRTELSRRFDQAAREKCGVPADQAPKGHARYCYQNTSKKFQLFASMILRQHDKARHDTGLAER